MNQLTLNAIALSVFGMTLSVLLGPFLHISPALSAGVILVGLSAVTVDGFQFQSLGLTLLLDTLARLSPQYRQRVLHHEAGHFLAASLLNLPIQSYSLSVWAAFRQGNARQGGVVLEQPSDIAPSDWLKANIHNLSTVWVAGGVAEDLKYGSVRGNEDDLRQLRETLAYLGLNIKLYEQQATRRARQLLTENWDAYELLVSQMELRQPAAECYEAVAQSKG
ncbi:ATP-dependent Zn protease [Altericista sp. CCNU0014]|uniref:ATP-dependent Zn protease n=1 Tax=Altericista sp. CCNU0014 TaxID=3082949 RepID=UPI00384ADE1A